jgi:DNA-binding Lrp family transcriptional regulator
VTDVTELEQRIIREMQRDLPIDPRPFSLVADRVGVSEGELLAKVRSMRERGIIREVNAVLRHRRVGFQANALCVWRVEAGQVDEVGAMFAGLPEVTHCYERETYPEWAYNIYTMVHALSQEACETRIRHMSEISGVADYRIFYSTQELKKTTMQYFRDC